MTTEYKGLVAPETSLRRIIDAGMAAIQQNDEILPRLLQRYEETERNSFLQYLTKTEIRARQGFALEGFEIPQITITLGSSNDERYLGDELFVRDRDLGVTAKVGAEIKSYDRAPFALAYTDLVGTLPALGRIRIGEEFFTYASLGAGVFNIAGRGANGSKKVGHAAGDEIRCVRIEYDRGKHEKVSYRIDVLTPNADVTMLLANMVQAVLVTNMNALLEAGFSEVSMSATDYAPRPAHYPMHTYVRTLMFSARVEFAVPETAAEGLSLEINEEITGVTMPTTPIVGGPL